MRLYTSCSSFFFSYADVKHPRARKPARFVPDAALKDLQNLEELQKLFNQDKGAPRLILLLSPT
jgi:hypothetical protein